MIINYKLLSNCTKLWSIQLSSFQVYPFIPLISSGYLYIYIYISKQGTYHEQTLIEIYGCVDIYIKDKINC